MSAVDAKPASTSTGANIHQSIDVPSITLDPSSTSTSGKNSSDSIADPEVENNEEKEQKIFGKTPDGTGKSTNYYIIII